MVADLKGRIRLVRNVSVSVCLLLGMHASRTAGSKAMTDLPRLLASCTLVTP